ncbi:MAG: hypothetical protein Q4G51_15550 [Dermatophilus congolensis]|nr:hypothetical protein [Dermatophilus congolensis]
MSRPIIESWVAAGLAGETTNTPSGIFISDEATHELANTKVIETIADIPRNVGDYLQRSPVFVARCRPETPRPTPETGPMGFNAQTAANGDWRGFDRWWTISDRAEVGMRDIIQREGGMPFLVTVRGLVGFAAEIVEIHRETDSRDVSFTLANVNPWWAAPFAKSRLNAGGGPRSTFWPTFPTVNTSPFIAGKSS